MSNNDLSQTAKRLLKHFQDKGLRERDFEIPATMLALFDDREKCEAAQAELENRGLIELGPEGQRPAPNRIRSAALTLEGVRFLQENPLV